jgi:hypothetical protein
VAQPRTLKLTPGGIRAEDGPRVGMMSPLGGKKSARDEMAFLASPFGTRGVLRREERGRPTEELVEEQGEGKDGPSSSVKKRIREWAMDTMHRASPVPSAPFPTEEEDVLSTSMRRATIKDHLHPPGLTSLPSDETVITTTTDSSGGGGGGIPPSPTPWNGMKRVLGTSRAQDPIGLGIFAQEAASSSLQQFKRGKRDMVVQVHDVERKVLSTSPTPSPSTACFKFKSYSSSAVPTLKSLESFGSDGIRERKSSSTDSVGSGVQYTLSSKMPEDYDSFSRRASSKLSISSIRGHGKKPSPLLDYRPQFTPPPCRPTLSPQLNGPDDPPSPFEASSDSANSRCNSFLRELQASTSRPPIARRTTAPAKASPKESSEEMVPPLPSNTTGNIASYVQAQSQFVGTPVHVFDSERPSPAAFMSTGLIKKGSGFSSKRTGSDHSLTASIIDSTGSLPTSLGRVRACLLPDSPDVRTPDTPIKHNVPNPLVHAKHRLPPLKFGTNPASTAPFVPTSLGICTNPSPDCEDAPRDDQSSLPAGDSAGTISGNSGKFPLGTGRGLRRKGSAMWARTNSGNWSNGSWSRQTTMPMDEDEPLTPTRNDDRAGE